MSTEKIDALVKDMVFNPDGKAKQKQIQDMAKEAGIFPASIQKLYDEIGQGKYQGFTVPAINLRGITYDTARTVFRSAMKNKVGAFIFEIARSEMGYTLQSPGEFVACVLAAALAEEYKGPVFIQADHTQVNRKAWETDANKELNAVRDLIRPISRPASTILISMPPLLSIMKSPISWTSRKTTAASRLE
jgi:hypothetical protein